MNCKGHDGGLYEDEKSSLNVRGRRRKKYCPDRGGKGGAKDTAERNAKRNYERNIDCS